MILWWSPGIVKSRDKLNSTYLPKAWPQNLTCCWRTIRGFYLSSHLCLESLGKLKTYLYLRNVFGYWAWQSGKLLWEALIFLFTGFFEVMWWIKYLISPLSQDLWPINLMKCIQRLKLPPTSCFFFLFLLVSVFGWTSGIFS